jgi:membrane protein DedA with SNARE-associated domain
VTFSLIGSLVGFITFVLATIGLPGLFALMAVESFGIPPIPSELVLPLAGFLVVDGTFPLDGTIVAAIAGSLVGAFIAYAVGRWWRSRLAGFGIGHLRIRESDLDRMDQWFAKHGEVTVLAGRLIPGVLSYISYPAGTARMRPSRFGLYTLLGSTPWTLGFIYAGIVLGNHWQVISQYFVPIDVVLVVVIVTAAVYLILVATGDLAPGWPPRRGPRRVHATVEPSTGPPKP